MARPTHVAKWHRMCLTYPFCLGVAVLVGSFTDMCMWINIASIFGRVILFFLVRMDPHAGVCTRVRVGDVWSISIYPNITVWRMAAFFRLDQQTEIPCAPGYLSCVAFHGFFVERGRRGRGCCRSGARSGVNIDGCGKRPVPCLSKQP